MKKTKLILVILLVFSSSLVTGANVVNADSNDSIHFDAFTVYSPLNRTYTTQSLTLNLTFAVGMGIKYSLSYNIDGEYVGSIPFTVDNPNETHVVHKATGFTELPELPEGSHHITVHLIAAGYQHRTLKYNGTVCFSIDTQHQENVIPEFSSWIFLPLLLTATSAILILRRNLKADSMEIS
jgi:hypothetical protein